jgi:alkylation response protein AidB-like acyl-CoA dehydrogenase
MTAAYTSQREQFGRPIATFQAVSHRAADAYIDVENLRLACQQAVSLLSAGADATEAVLIAKIWASDVAHRVSQSAQHLHGGIGVDKDYALFRYCLWAKQLELTLGGGKTYLTALGDSIAEDFKRRNVAQKVTPHAA